MRPADKFSGSHMTPGAVNTFFGAALKKSPPLNHPITPPEEIGEVDEALADLMHEGTKDGPAVVGATDATHNFVPTNFVPTVDPNDPSLRLPVDEVSVRSACVARA